jgi:hypothetical protein
MAALGSNPIPTLSFAALWGWFVAALTHGTHATAVLPDCSGWNVVTGCDSTISAIFTILALGTIPSAPPEVNALFAILGLTCRGAGIWAVMQLIRG